MQPQRDSQIRTQDRSTPPEPELTGGTLPSGRAAIDALLEATRTLKRFLADAAQHATDGSGTDWEALVDQGRSAHAALQRAPALAAALFAEGADFGRDEPARQVVRAWPEHRARHEVVGLFERHGTDRRIVTTIDETLSEDDGSLLELLERDARRRLLELLEAEVARFGEALLTGLEPARDRRQRRDALATLLPARPTRPLGGGIAVADALGSGALGANDTELIVAAIITLAWLD